MNQINMNRGFDSMIPKSKEASKEKQIFNHEIKFDLFKKEFKLQFQVKSTPE